MSGLGLSLQSRLLREPLRREEYLAQGWAEVTADLSGEFLVLRELLNEQLSLLGARPEELSNTPPPRMFMLGPTLWARQRPVREDLEQLGYGPQAFYMRSRHGLAIGPELAGALTAPAGTAVAEQLARDVVAALVHELLHALSKAEDLALPEQRALEEGLVVLVGNGLRPELVSRLGLSETDGPAVYDDAYPAESEATAYLLRLAAGRTLRQAERLSAPDERVPQLAAWLLSMNSETERPQALAKLVARSQRLDAARTQDLAGQVAALYRRLGEPRYQWQVSFRDGVVTDYAPPESVVPELKDELKPLLGRRPQLGTLSSAAVAAPTSEGPVIDHL